MLSQTMQKQFEGWSYNRPVAGLGDAGGSVKDPSFGSIPEWATRPRPAQFLMVSFGRSSRRIARNDSHLYFFFFYGSLFCLLSMFFKCLQMAWGSQLKESLAFFYSWNQTLNIDPNRNWAPCFYVMHIASRHHSRQAPPSCIFLFGCSRWSHLVRVFPLASRWCSLRHWGCMSNAYIHPSIPSNTPFVCLFRFRKVELWFAHLSLLIRWSDPSRNTHARWKWIHLLIINASYTLNNHRVVFLAFTYHSFHWLIPILTCRNGPRRFWVMQMTAS